MEAVRKLCNILISQQIFLLWFPSKTHRVRRIMKSATKFKRIQLSTYEVMIPMACLLTVNIIILTVLT